VIIEIKVFTIEYNILQFEIENLKVVFILF